MLRTLTILAVLAICQIVKAQRFTYTHKFNAIVDVPAYGKVEGFSVGSYYHNKPEIRINHFLGVPYARRPDQFGDYRTEFRFKVSTNRT